MAANWPISNPYVAGEGNLFMKYSYGQGKHLIAKMTTSPDVVDDMAITTLPQSRS
jgi:hypothetical protein